MYIYFRLYRGQETLVGNIQTLLSRLILDEQGKKWLLAVVTLIIHW